MNYKLVSDLLYFDKKNMLHNVEKVEKALDLLHLI